MEVVEINRVPTEKDKTTRFYGILENGEEVYLSRFSGFVAIAIKEERKEENE